MCLGAWSKLGFMCDADIRAAAILPDVIGGEEELELGWDYITYDLVSSHSLGQSLSFSYSLYSTSTMYMTLSSTHCEFLAPQTLDKPSPLPLKYPLPTERVWVCMGSGLRLM